MKPICDYVIECSAAVAILQHLSGFFSEYLGWYRDEY